VKFRAGGVDQREKIVVKFKMLQNFFKNPEKEVISLKYQN
jgi:hypothetical protein